MTEDEAKTKWCPFARKPWTSYDATPQGVNRARDGAKAVKCNCLASGCMAWRVETEARWFDAVGQGAHVKQVSVGGHCGLAGSPR